MSPLLVYEGFSSMTTCRSVGDYGSCVWWPRSASRHKTKPPPQGQGIMCPMRVRHRLAGLVKPPASHLTAAILSHQTIRCIAFDVKTSPFTIEGGPGVVLPLTCAPLYQNHTLTHHTRKSLVYFLRLYRSVLQSHAPRSACEVCRFLSFSLSTNNERQFLPGVHSWGKWGPV
jgi:hypothetical protein